MRGGEKKDRGEMRANKDFFLIDKKVFPLIPNDLYFRIPFPNTNTVKVLESIKDGTDRPKYLILELNLVFPYDMPKEEMLKLAINAIKEALKA